MVTSSEGGWGRSHFAAGCRLTLEALHAGKDGLCSDDDGAGSPRSLPLSDLLLPPLATRCR